jgi:hypothetical protein
MYYDKIQLWIDNFIEKANQVLPEEHAFYFGRHFATGQMYYPNILFVGINPGYETKKWDIRPKIFERMQFEEVPCKFIGEYADKLKLATQVVNILLNGDISRLGWCAETSLKSVFATPNVTILDQTLSLLPSELRQEHDQITEYLLSKIHPQQIVCIGLTTFSEYLKRFGKDGYAAPIMKSFPSSTGKSDPIYHKYTVVRGIPVYGLLHLSGAQLSANALDDLQSKFKEIWERIDQGNMINNPYRNAQQPNESTLYHRAFHFIDSCARQHAKSQQEYTDALLLGRAALINVVDNLSHEESLTDQFDKLRFINKFMGNAHQAIYEAISSKFLNTNEPFNDAIYSMF